MFNFRRVESNVLTLYVYSIWETLCLSFRSLCDTYSSFCSRTDTWKLFDVSKVLGKTDAVSLLILCLFIHGYTVTL